MSSAGGINWSTVYNTPIGGILADLSPTTFALLLTQETGRQQQTYNAQVSQDQSQISAWTTLQADSGAVLSDLSTLANASTYSQLTTTSSASNIATAVDQSAQAGSYSLYVQSLAQAEIDQGSSANMAVTNPNATLVTPAGTALQGVFSIQLSGQSSAVSITMPSAGESLNALASQINHTAGIGVTASVVQNSSGNWILDLQANQTGQSITYTDSPGSSGQSYGPLYYLGIVSSDGSTPGTSTLSAANALQAASSAEVSFGTSFNSSNYITSSTNTITNLIPGMTVNLLGTGAATVTVAPNTSAMTTSVQQFATDWNQWVTDTQALAQAGSVTESGSGANATYSYTANSKQVLTSGIPTVALNTVQQLLGTTTNGLSSNAYQSLADIGVTFSATGKLTVNSATLDGALTQDPTAVQAIFQQLVHQLGVSGSSNGVISQFSQGPGSTTGQAIATLQSQVSKDQTAISQLKQQLTVEENQAIAQYGQWVNQIAGESQKYSLLSALFNTGTNNNTTNGG